MIHLVHTGFLYTPRKFSFFFFFFSVGNVFDDDDSQGGEKCWIYWTGQVSFFSKRQSVYSRSSVGNGRKGNVLLGCETEWLYMSSVGRICVCVCRIDITTRICIIREPITELTITPSCTVHTHTHTQLYVQYKYITSTATCSGLASSKTNMTMAAAALSSDTPTSFFFYLNVYCALDDFFSR